MANWPYPKFTITKSEIPLQKNTSNKHKHHNQLSHKTQKQHTSNFTFHLKKYFQQA